MSINLHTILKYFDCEVTRVVKIEETQTASKKDKVSTKISDLMKENVGHDQILEPFNIQSVATMPKLIREIIPKNYHRIGIAGVICRGINKVDYSFLYSLLIMFYPEIRDYIYDDQIKNLLKFIEFVELKIKGNYFLDKRRNSKKIQEMNRQLAERVKNGEVDDVIIEYMANFFELNIIIVDPINDKVRIYYTHTSKNNFFNPLRPLMCLSRINNSFEPVTVHETRQRPTINPDFYISIFKKYYDIEYYPSGIPKINQFSLFYYVKVCDDTNVFFTMFKNIHEEECLLDLDD